MCRRFSRFYYWCYYWCWFFVALVVVIYVSVSVDVTVSVSVDVAVFDADGESIYVADAAVGCFFCSKSAVKIHSYYC